MTISNNEIESELSYAYVHAVVSRAGYSCATCSRQEDNMGFDVRIIARDNFTGPIKTAPFHIQLKATTLAPTKSKHGLSYFFKGSSQYNNLCNADSLIPTFLVVLFLPPDPDEWLTLNHDSLILKKCAYWVSLRKAPLTTNSSGATIYLPNEQLFDTHGLKELAAKVAAREDIDYHAI